MTLLHDSSILKSSVTSSIWKQPWLGQLQHLSRVWPGLDQDLAVDLGPAFYSKRYRYSPKHTGLVHIASHIVVEIIVTIIIILLLSSLFLCQELFWYLVIFEPNPDHPRGKVAAAIAWHHHRTGCNRGCPKGQSSESAPHWHPLALQVVHQPRSVHPGLHRKCTRTICHYAVELAEVREQPVSSRDLTQDDEMLFQRDRIQKIFRYFQIHPASWKRRKCSNSDGLWSTQTSSLQASLQVLWDFQRENQRSKSWDHPPGSFWIRLFHFFIISGSPESCISNHNFLNVKQWDDYWISTTSPNLRKYKILERLPFQQALLLDILRPLLLFFSPKPIAPWVQRNRRAAPPAALPALPAPGPAAAALALGAAAAPAVEAPDSFEDLQAPEATGDLANS